MGWRALYFQYLSNVLVLHSVFNLTLCPVVKTNTEASRRAGDLSRTWAFFSFPGKMSKSRGVLEIQTIKHFLGPHYGYVVSEWLATEEGCHFLLSRSLQDESVPGTMAIQTFLFKLSAFSECLESEQVDSLVQPCADMMHIGKRLPMDAPSYTWELLLDHSKQSERTHSNGADDQIKTLVVHRDGREQVSTGSRKGGDHTHYTSTHFHGITHEQLGFAVHWQDVD